MVAQRDIEFLADRVLADSARHGGRGAFDELYHRHASASWRLALAVTRHPGAAESAVASAFATTLAGRPAPTGATDERLRLMLLRATRRAAIDAVGQGSTVRPATGMLSFEAGEGRTTLIQRSFDALPERRRSIVWLVDVEGCSLHDAARVLELEPGSAAPLADRARLSLREQVLQAGVRHPLPQDCRRSTDRLSGYLMGTLSEGDEARVRSHLDGCASCRDCLAALDDLAPVLRGAALALPVFLADAAVQRWSTSLVRDSGRLHLALPGGQAMPQWAQRAFAGALAAVITLGITGATMIASRDRARENTALPLGTANGESALAVPGLDELVLDGSGFLPASLLTAPRPVAATPPAGGVSSSAPLPRSAGDLTSPIAGLNPTAAPPAPGSTPTPVSTTPSTTPPPPPPPPAEPVATVGIGDVVGVTVGDECTGAQVLGTPIGCPPPPSDDPVTLDAALPSTPTGL